MNTEGLIDWQIPAVRALRTAVEKHGVCLNASSCGTGKTHETVALLRHYNRPTLVVAPLPTLSIWERVLKSMGTEATVTNYEKAKRKLSPFGRWTNPRLSSHLVWEWDRQIEDIVFDEVHRCKGVASRNSELLLAAKRQKKRVFMLSGTPAQSPVDMKALGYALDFYGRPFCAQDDWLQWCLANGCQQIPMRGLHFTGSAAKSQLAIMAEFHAHIFPEYGVRLRTRDIPGFPQTRIIAEEYRVENPGKIEEIYRAMAAAVERWKLRRADDRDSEHPLTKMLRERQMVELLKVPTLVELIRDSVDGGNHVCLFASFRETLTEIYARLDQLLEVPPLLYHGGVSPALRDTAVDTFQRNQNPVMLLQIDSGGTGLNLDDTDGGHPRDTYLCAGFSALNLQQALRRVHRATSKSKSTQHIVFAEGTVESKVRKTLTRKLDNLDALTDADLTPENLRLEGVILA